MRVFFKYFISFFVLCGSIAVFAGNTISITPTGTVFYKKEVGQTGVLSYQFSLKNTTATPLYLNMPTPPTGGLNVTLDAGKTTCHFNDTNERLASEDSCVFAYESSVPGVSGSFTDTVTVLGWGYATSADFGVAVYKVGALPARFVFRENGSDVTSLNLSKGTTGNIFLHNTGTANAKGVGVTIPASIKAYFSGDCKTITALPKNGICTLHYTIPANATSGINNITAEANNAPTTVATVILGGSKRYVANGGKLSVCTLMVNGDLNATSCVVAVTQTHLLTGVLFVSLGTNNKLYLYDSSGLRVCTLTTDGDLTPHSCAANVPQTTPLKTYVTNIKQGRNGKLYVTDALGSGLRVCKLTDGDLTPNSCAANVPQIIPFGGNIIDVAVGVHRKILYISTASNGTISVCKLTTDGDLTSNSCAEPVKQNNPLVWPTRMAVSANGKLLYVTDVNNNTVRVCKLTTNGDLTPNSCAAGVPQTNPFVKPKGLVIGENGKLYVINLSTNVVRVCTLTTNGDLTPNSCPAGVPQTTPLALIDSIA